VHFHYRGLQLAEEYSTFLLERIEIIRTRHDYSEWWRRWHWISVEEWTRHSDHRTLSIALPLPIFSPLTSSCKFPSLARHDLFPSFVSIHFLFSFNFIHFFRSPSITWICNAILHLIIIIIILDKWLRFSCVTVITITLHTPWILYIYYVM
jgi:hypothetical protein